MTTIDAWRGFSTMRADRTWPERWGEAAGLAFRAVGDASATLCRLTVGSGAVRIHCLLAGHDDRFVREPGRLRLRCEACGRATPGWAIATGPPRVASRLPGRRPAFRVISGVGRRSSTPASGARPVPVK
jgi:hypothetical protein